MAIQYRRISELAPAHSQPSLVASTGHSRCNVVAVQKRVAFDTSDFRSLLSYNKCIRNVGFRTFPMHL